MIFDLIYQRTRRHRDLLLLFDEPFAGVTEDFLPFIQDRLAKLRENHNIVLVTNDHVELLRGLADNTIVVSALDRTKVTVNNRVTANREDAMQVLSVGKDYTEKASYAEYRFFWNVEVARNRSLLNLGTATNILRPYWWSPHI
jgi:ABC-type proline/glycine betaine transport system ATPase subunit